VYFDYIKERENLDHIQTPRGFAVFKKVGEILFVSEIYVKEEHRTSGEFLGLYKKINEIAKFHNCSEIEGHVYIETNNPTDSLRAILSAGFIVFAADEDKIVLRKEVV